MSLLYLNDSLIKSFIDYNNSLKLLRTALIEYSKKNVNQPVRQTIPVDQNGSLFLSMPSQSQLLNIIGAKIITKYPNNKDVPIIQGLILVYNNNTGSPEAVLDAPLITGLRTSFVSTIGSQCFASESSEVLSIIGSGVQAEWHVDSHMFWKNWSTIYIIGRDQYKTEQFVEKLNQKHKTNIIKVAIDKKKALLDSDIICTVTTSKKPVLSYDMLKPSVHINCVGSSTPDAVEIDEETIMNGKIIVDSKEATLSEAGVIIQYKPDIICEIGEYLADNSKYDIIRNELTIFKHVGMSIEDVIIADDIVKKYKSNKKV